MGEELAFATIMTKLAQDNLASVTAREWRSQLRAYVLKKFQREAQYLSTHDLVQAAARDLSTVLFQSSHVCVGILMPRGDTIHYATTSAGSALDRNWFRRAQTLNLPLFKCVDERKICVALSAKDSVEGGEPLNAGWPWISVPLARNQSTVRGVLTIDRLERVPKGRPDEKQPDPGACDVLEAIGIVLGTAIDLNGKANEINSLEGLHGQQHRTSLDEIFEAGLQALRRQLIFASGVAVWHLRTPLTLEEHKANNLTLRLYVVKIERLNLSVVGEVGVFAVILLNGAEVGRTEPVKVDARHGGNLAPELFAIPLGNEWIYSSLRLDLWFNLSATHATRIGSLLLQGSSYLHISGSERTYMLANNETRKPLAQTTALTVSMQLSNNTVSAPTKQSISPTRRIWNEIQLTAVSIKGVRSGSYECVFRDDNGVELGRTPNSPYTLAPTWADLKICVSALDDPFPHVLNVELVTSFPDNELGSVVAQGVLSGTVLISIPRGETRVEVNLNPVWEVGEVAQASSSRSKNMRPNRKPSKVTAVLSLTETVCRNPVKYNFREETALEPVCSYRLDGDSIIAEEESRHQLDDKALLTVVEAIHHRVPCWVQGEGDVPSRLFAPMEDLTVCVGNLQVGPHRGPWFTVVVETHRHVESADDESFASTVARAIETSVRYVRLRQLREVVRNRAENEIAALCDDYNGTRTVPLEQVLDTTLKLSGQCLPGCSLYIALLQPGGDELCYIACNDLSTMRGNRLHRGQGVSFECVGPKTVAETVVACSGDERVVVFGKHTSMLPFICVPLAVDGAVIGVLGADTFDHVSNVREGADELPEESVLAFLRCVGTRSATAVNARMQCDVMLALPPPGENWLSRLFDWTLWATCRIALYTVVCELWEMNERNEFRVVARLTPDRLQRDLQITPSTKVDAPVVVAAEPAAVRRRTILEDKIGQPLLLVKTDEAHDLARRNYLCPSTQDNKAADLSAVITELALGQLVDIALHGIEHRVKASVVEDEPKRIVLPCTAHPQPLLLVIGTRHVNDKDIRFLENVVAELRRHFPRALDFEVQSGTREHIEASAPTPSEAPACCTAPTSTAEEAPAPSRQPHVEHE